MLLLELSGGYHLLVHLKMTGQLIVQRPGERIKSVPQFNGAGFPQVQLPHSHTMATFVLTGGTRMYYNDLRRFGYLRLVRNIDLPQVAAIAESGIEPLSRNFTFGAFADLLAKTPNQTIKEFLLDARRVAGIGNIYADEILFRARIRPTRRIRTLATHERRAVFQSVRPILTAAVRARGSSVGDFFDVTGTPGRYGLRHRVYGRAGKPCHRDGTTLKRVVVAGRGTVFCPACQS
jgi:formamidopyrimidine-DNA glycosylase